MVLEMVLVVVLVVLDVVLRLLLLQLLLLQLRVLLKLPSALGGGIFVQKTSNGSCRLPRDSTDTRLRPLEAT